MTAIEIHRFEQADETRKFEHGSFEVVTIGGVTIGGRATNPGGSGRSTSASRPARSSARWSTSGSSSRDAPASGWRTGPRPELTPGDLFAIGPGHDSWVVGDEPYVSLHLLGASEYAKH